MKLDPRLFLEAIGTRLVGDPLETGRTVPMSCKCPLHSESSDMTVVLSGNGEYLFRCGHCGFLGDAVSLVATKFGVSTQAVVNMFKHDGVLSGCLEEPILSSEADSISGKASLQARIKAYLSKCSEQLARNPTKARLRAGLDVSTYHLVPPEVGLLVVSDDMPDSFAEYKKAKYRKSTLLTFPYTFNGDVMHVKIVDATTQTEIDDIGIIRPDLGVFGESVLFDGTKKPVQVVTNPVAASVFYGTLRKGLLDRPRIVSVSGFPLPYGFAGISTVSLIEFSDSRVSIDFMLEALGGNDIVDGSQGQPNIRFFRRACQSLDAKIELYDRAVDASRPSDIDGFPIVQILAERMSELVGMGKTSQVEDALRRHPPSDENRDRLLVEIKDRNLNDECRTLLSGMGPGGPRRLVLGNRKAIVTEPTAIYVEKPDFSLDPLSNFGLKVSNRTRVFDGTEVLNCTITPEDKNVSPIDIGIPEDMWSSCTRMRKLVSKAFSSKGSSPYIAMYSPSGIDWYDVMLKLAEGCRIQREIVKLGVDEFGDIQFPRMTICTRTKSMQPQDDVLNIPADVCSRYGSVGERDGLDTCYALELLLSKSDSVHVAAFLAGLGFMVYRTACIAKRGKKPSHGGRHLFFVETEDGFFESTIDQLNGLFSDEPVVEINPGSPVKSLSRFKQLGTLPLVCRIPRVDNIHRLLSVLDEIEFPVIASVDSHTASLVNGRIRAEYVTPSNEFPNPCEVPEAAIHSLETCMPRLLLETCTGEVQDDAGARAPSSVLGYRMLCKLAGFQDNGCVKKMTSLVFAGAGMSGVDSFFDRLHYGLTGISEKFRICATKGMPQPGHSFTGRGQHIFILDNVVLIGKYVVDLVNKFSSNVFNIQQLDSELSEREFLVAPPQDLYIDTTRCWCIPFEVYEDRILGKPLTLEKITQ